MEVTLLCLAKFLDSGTEVFARLFFGLTTLSLFELMLNKHVELQLGIRKPEIRHDLVTFKRCTRYVCTVEESYYSKARSHE